MRPRSHPASVMGGESGALYEPGVHTLLFKFDSVRITELIKRGDADRAVNVDRALNPSACDVRAVLLPWMFVADETVIVERFRACSVLLFARDPRGEQASRYYSLATIFGNGVTAGNMTCLGYRVNAPADADIWNTVFTHPSTLRGWEASLVRVKGDPCRALNFWPWQADTVIIGRKP